MCYACLRLRVCRCSKQLVRRDVTAHYKRRFNDLVTDTGFTQNVLLVFHKSLQDAEANERIRQDICAERDRVLEREMKRMNREHAVERELLRGEINSGVKTKLTALEEEMRTKKATERTRVQVALAVRDHKQLTQLEKRRADEKERSEEVAVARTYDRDSKARVKRLYESTRTAHDPALWGSKGEGEKVEKLKEDEQKAVGALMEDLGRVRKLRVAEMSKRLRQDMEHGRGNRIRQFKEIVDNLCNVQKEKRLTVATVEKRFVCARAGVRVRVDDAFDVQKDRGLTGATVEKGVVVAVSVLACVSACE